MHHDEVLHRSAAAPAGVRGELVTDFRVAGARPGRPLGRRSARESRARHRTAGALAALYDAEGARAYDVAVFVLGDDSAAARAVESAFGELASGYEPARTAAGRRTVMLTALARALAAEIEHALAAGKPTPSHLGPVLDALPPDERQALAYCGRGAVSVTVAAAILGRDVATIHAQLGRALRHVSRARGT